MWSIPGAAIDHEPTASLGAMLETGDQAPDFELPDQDGNAVKLMDLEGQTVVLYFYPKADTQV
jgi:peroxiredoxin